MTDSKTLPDALQAITERFGVKDAVLVGDRGMITQAHAQTLKENGVGFISALKALQIRSLVNAGDIQLSLFDEANLAEISSEKFPGERLVVCRNPAVAAERARKRQELLDATEAELQTVKRMVGAHIFLCMLAYYVTFELAQRLTPLLFTDQTPLAPADPVAPATRSKAAKATGEAVGPMTA
jgi:hypothetical protein